MWNWNSGKKTAGESDLSVIDKEVVLEIEGIQGWENKDVSV